MPEAQTYSTFRSWEITRKASSTSEQRDWYAEYTSFVNQIDKDANNATPMDKVIAWDASGTGFQNGLKVTTMYNHAKTLSPTATSRVLIRLAPGLYQFTGQFVMDTDYIDFECYEGSNRSQWTDTPLWSEVTRAGARFYLSTTSGGTEQAAVKITAQHVRIGGVDFSSIRAGGNLQYGLEMNLNVGTYTEKDVAASKDEGEDLLFKTIDHSDCGYSIGDSITHVKFPTGAYNGTFTIANVWNDSGTNDAYSLVSSPAWVDSVSGVVVPGSANATTCLWSVPHPVDRYYHLQDPVVVPTVGAIGTVTDFEDTTWNHTGAITVVNNLGGGSYHVRIGAYPPATAPSPSGAAGKGIDFKTANSCYKCFNTHVEGSFDEYAEGLFLRCSGSGNENFKWSGKTYPTLVKECLFVSSPVGSDADNDDGLFDDCDIFGASVLVRGAPS